MNKGAVISSCKRYRYRLWRRWDESKPVLVFIMLNPSTADGEEDDPTIRKCIGFAKLHDFGGIEVVNLFAWQATDPAALRKQSSVSITSIVGSENNRFIDIAASLPNATVVFAWGTHAQGYIHRMFEVRDLVRRRLLLDRGVGPQCLGYTSMTRQPRHPLMVSYATPLEGYMG